MKWETLILAASIILLGLVVMMVRDAPDWETTTNKIEVVQRLNLLYPSGKIFSIDLFEGPVQTWKAIATSPSYARLNTTKSFVGVGSMKLAKSSAVDSDVTITKNMGLLASKKIGFEMVYGELEANVTEIRIYIEYNTGTTYILASVKYDTVNEKWLYESAEGVWTDIPGAEQNIFPLARLWHRLKLIVDFDSKKFVKLYSNDKIFDLSSLGTYETTYASGEYIHIEVVIAAAAGQGGVMYIDYIAITEED